MVKYDVYGCCFGQCHLVWLSHLISTCLRRARVVYMDVGRELSVWPIGKSASGRSCGRLYVRPFMRALLRPAIRPAVRILALLKSGLSTALAC